MFAATLYPGSKRGPGVKVCQSNPLLLRPREKRLESLSLCTGGNQLLEHRLCFPLKLLLPVEKRNEKSGRPARAELAVCSYDSFSGELSMVISVGARTSCLQV